MDEQASLLAAINEQVVLHAPNPVWPARFMAERERLLGLGPDLFIDVQHIGSTAVPGLATRPVIDLLAGGGRPWWRRAAWLTAFPEVLLVLPLQRQAVHPRQRVRQVPVAPARHRLRGAGQRRAV
ncbi:MAG TPA: GrpB family protein, partial [Burkholderiaceae bacterium]|nr:GrpB family protein [Burkholderiaceae bacterium]